LLTLVNVIDPVAVVTGGGHLFISLAPLMTVFALKITMSAGQQKFCIAIMIENDIPPLIRRVTSAAVNAIFSLMHIMSFVTIHASCS
jgi:hypothetical protein